MRFIDNSVQKFKKTMADKEHRNDHLAKAGNVKEDMIEF
jgi:hypothetical protein